MENIGLPRKVAQSSGRGVRRKNESFHYLTLHSVDESQVVRAQVASDREYAKKLFDVENTPVKFQLDSGRTCDLIPAKFLRTEAELFPT